MGLFVGDSEPSKIFVGDTPISKVFLGDTQVRPSYTPYPWQPGANTYIYYPLTSDLVDVMGNGDTGTMYGTCTFDSNRNTGIHVAGRSGNYVTGLSNGVGDKDTFTINVWVKHIWNNNVGYLVGYGATNSAGQSFCIAEYGGYVQSLLCDGTTQHWDNLYSSDSDWHNICISGDNGVFDVYCDANFIATNDVGFLADIQELQLGYGGTYTYRRGEECYVGHYIVERVARTAQEISAYYNLTKGIYGL